MKDLKLQFDQFIGLLTDKISKISQEHSKMLWREWWKVMFDRNSGYNDLKGVKLRNKCQNIQFGAKTLKKMFL